MAWTKMLRNVKEVVDGRLIMVETQMACYYRYVIFEADTVNYGKPIVKGNFDHHSWKAALSAGKKYLITLNPQIK